MHKIKKRKLEEHKKLAEKNERKMWQDAAGADTIKHLGPISKEEYDYYSNLCSSALRVNKTVL